MTPPTQLVPDDVFFEHLAHVDFAPLYDRVEGQPELEPGDVLPTDRVLTRGTGRDHKGRRKEESP